MVATDGRIVPYKLGTGNVKVSSKTTAHNCSGWKQRGANR